MAETLARTPLPLEITMSEPSARQIDGAAWDAFALVCHGSFLGMWRIVRVNCWLSRVRIFEFFVTEGEGSRRKIGQCAVAVAGRRVRFLDRLHLLPASPDDWQRCMRLIIERCGAGIYEYGSAWNAENRCPPDGGVGSSVSRALPLPRFLIDYVDFRRWRDFDHYRTEVSENIRRDYRKAAAASAVVETRSGLAALGDVVALARLRREVMRRNRQRFSMVMDVARHVLKIACIGERAFIATVRAEGRCPAAFFGVRFGEDVYYLAGGTEKNKQGYGSYLFLTLIEDWFRTRPAGKLYLGRQQSCVAPAAYNRPNNHLYRRKLRATCGPGTAFHFEVSQPATVSNPTVDLSNLRSAP